MRTEQDAIREDIVKIKRNWGSVQSYWNSLRLLLSQVNRDMEMDGNDFETEERLIALAEEYETKIKRVQGMIAMGD